MLNTPHRLTPAEMARLRGIASRVRIGSLRNDARPFVRVSYDDSPAERTDTVIPWREAMEIEDD